MNVEANVVESIPEAGTIAAVMGERRRVKHKELRFQGRL